MATVTIRRRGVSGRVVAGCGTVAGQLDAPAAAMLAATIPDGKVDERVLGRTAAEIAANVGRPASLIEALLEDERRRGHVERDDHGRYSPSPEFARRYGAAFADVWGDTT